MDSSEIREESLSADVIRVDEFDFRFADGFDQVDAFHAANSITSGGIGATGEQDGEKTPTTK